MGGGALVEIIILAMIAGFVALRLYSVLGRRTGHEQPLGQPVDTRPRNAAAQVSPRAEQRGEVVSLSPAMVDPGATEGLRAIVAADPDFDVGRFLEGAKLAYGMVLDAFWKGDPDALQPLTDDNVAQDFIAAIEQRKAEGLTLENRLVRIEQARIVDAALNNRMAVVTVRFDADIVAVSRDRDGNIVAGSTSDAVGTHDVWTFSRHVGMADPNWLLVATDDEAGA